MARDTTDDPKTLDTGRKAYREPGESVDEWPVIAHRPFWRDHSEELAWLFAVEQCRKFRGGPLTQHLERIALVAGKELAGKPAKDMPRLPYRDDDEIPEVPVELTDARAGELARQREAILGDTPAEAKP